MAKRGAGMSADSGLATYRDPDSGISGTTTNRSQFQEMLARAREGAIDLILTKSISRFARNTVDLLATVRELIARSTW